LRALPLIVVLAVGLSACGATHAPAAQIPPGWPPTVVLGLRDAENGAAALRAQAPLRLRYHYLSGGVNTGRGWRTFADGDGSFVGGYVADSQANGLLSLFSYYQLLQSAPGSAQADERLRTTVNLASRATMAAASTTDGGFFKQVVAQYVGGGELPASTVVVAPAPAAAPAWARFTLGAAVRRTGRLVRVRARVTSAAAVSATVVVEVRRPGKAIRRVARKQWSSRAFKPGAARSFTLAWRVPAGTKAGRYGVVVRVIERRGAARRTTARRVTTLRIRG